jgi:hypothetical protein
MNMGCSGRVRTMRGMFLDVTINYPLLVRELVAAQATNNCDGGNARMR